MPKIRLQKYCSEQGLASRRKAEEYIAKGWVKVNGQVVTELGTKIDPKVDIVEFNQHALKQKESFKYVLLNKPVGYVSNLPQGNEKEAKDLLPASLKNLHPVGRLDKDSEGLLFLTNDGVVARRLASPEFEHEKEYAVTVNRLISQEALIKFQAGVIILGQKTKPVTVKRLHNLTYCFILREGKNRQIRRMLEKFGYQVIKLKRTRIASLKLGDLGIGQYRLLTKTERAKITTGLVIRGVPSVGRISRQSL